MSTPLRIATFNIENLTDEPPEDARREPTFEERVAVLRPQLERLRADVLCLQEVHGQEEPTRLRALESLLEGTRYEPFQQAATKTSQGDNYKERNLAVLSRFPISESRQLRHDITPQPEYKKVTAQPEEPAKPITWERPVLYARIALPDGSDLHVVNLHLKSKIPTPVAGQKEGFAWKSVAGWAEGYFLSSVKRVGQALEARMFIDSLFDAEPEARVIVCGDFNADLDAVPIEAIRGRVENTENFELIGRVMLPAETTVPEPSRYSLFHHGKEQMLDHLLASRSMLAFYRHTEVHNEQIHDESVAFAFDKKFPESDHAAVITEFSLP
ncbi:MAG: endonuclease [Gammaproteobacteria bacterium]|nr:endonuclease [Gammaproteobacteria bacterium]NIR82052.1 endonuclease [Gammaproteobacteria bacterium]NIR89280.1 endonuclease [Gammaproteobacteria bacterium]NIU03162.1 endonuclease [Gammaproteobacteria bacterium]NIV50678.1 endonuclease [Gammaproteobacteria bacterium]